ncbi:hypothetical protein CRE_08344 [Caenorhabditis remanei]|uniref:Uncharacterized protein n=1 Tax=Caenorhabditis remanei TaxID=31234 RepID=E3MPJ3_CAERE|nr:hypothetical protein CRE_08344 [Caenorhabditis remanei]
MTPVTNATMLAHGDVPLSWIIFLVCFLIFAIVGCTQEICRAFLFCKNNRATDRERRYVRLMNLIAKRHQRCIVAQNQEKRPFVEDALTEESIV